MEVILLAQTPAGVCWVSRLTADYLVLALCTSDRSVSLLVTCSITQIYLVLVWVRVVSSQRQDSQMSSPPLSLSWTKVVWWARHVGLGHVICCVSNTCLLKILTNEIWEHLTHWPLSGCSPLLDHARVYECTREVWALHPYVTLHEA